MAEPDPEAEIEVNMQAVCEGETRELKTLADLRKFLQDYLNFYSFIREAKQSSVQQPLQEITQWANNLANYVNRLGSWQDGHHRTRTELEQGVRAVLNSDSGANLPHPRSIRAEKIKRIWQEHGADAGAGAAVLATRSNQLDSVWKNREAAKGALAYILADPGLENSAARDAETSLKNALSRFEGARDHLLEEIVKISSDHTEQIKVHDKALDQIQASFAVAIQGLAAEYDKRAKNAVASIENTEKTYTEFMKLAAPREYWADKARKHTNQSAQLMTLALGWLVVAGGALGLGLWWFILPLGGNGCDVSSIESIRQWLLPNAPPVECPKEEITLWTYLPRAALGLILSTVFFWVARLFVRLWLSEVHLGMDAEERVVMVDSYLALKHEGHVEDKDRAIILTPLFRPTQDGIVKDDAAVDPTTLGLMRIWERN